MTTDKQPMPKPQMPKPQMSGLGPGTILMTSEGEMPVEWLAPGDKVLTRDRGAQPVIWIKRMRANAPGAAPLPAPLVLFPGDCGRAATPWEKLRLCPGHRVLLRLPEVELNFAEKEVLASVSDLSRRGAPRLDPDMGPLVYHHIVMPRHELILAGGLWVESTDAAMAAQLDAPNVVRRSSDLFQSGSKTVRMCLTSEEAQMIRKATPSDMSLMDLIAA